MPSRHGPAGIDGGAIAKPFLGNPAEPALPLRRQWLGLLLLIHPAGATSTGSHFVVGGQYALLNLRVSPGYPWNSTGEVRQDLGAELVRIQRLRVLAWFCGLVVTMGPPGRPPSR